MSEASVQQAEIAVEQEHVDRVHHRLGELRTEAEAMRARSYEHGKEATPEALYERDVMVHHANRTLQALDAESEGLVFGRLDLASGDTVHIDYSGSSPQSRHGINVVLNTAVAESLEQFADALEGSKDFEADLQALIRSVLIKHKRILFNGNGYDDAWLAEAERRGLLNLRTTPEALPYYLADKNVALFTKHRVYTRTEMEARYEIHLENYSKVLNIEALTMLEMARRDIMPAVSSYLRELSETAAAIHAASVTADCSYEESIIPEMSALLGDAYRKVRRLDEALMGAKTVEGSQALANYYRDKVFSAMAELRITIDQLETMTPSDKWPVPSYGDLLFSVR